MGEEKTRKANSRVYKALWGQLHLVFWVMSVRSSKRSLILR